MKNPQAWFARLLKFLAVLLVILSGLCEVQICMAAESMQSQLRSASNGDALTQNETINLAGPVLKLAMVTNRPNRERCEATQCVPKFDACTNAVQCHGSRVTQECQNDSLLKASQSDYRHCEKDYKYCLNVCFALNPPADD